MKENINKGSLLRKYISSDDILIMPTVYDPFNAIIAQKCGIKACAMSGSTNSVSILGKPDKSFLSVDLMAQKACFTNAVIDIPMIIDADTGYGNALNVAYVVERFENSGCAGLFIEDQTFPKRCGFLSGLSVIPLEEMAAKIKAAIDSRKNPDFLIMARTDSFKAIGLDEAIRRMNVLHDIGADLLYIDAIGELPVEQFSQIPKKVKGKLAVSIVESKTPLYSKDQLQEMGYKIAVYPGSNGFAIGKAATTVFQHLAKYGTTEGIETSMIPFEEYHGMVGTEKAMQTEESYAKFEEMVKKSKL